MSTQAWQLRSAASCPRHAVRGVRSICSVMWGRGSPTAYASAWAREVSVIFQTSGLAEAKKLLGEFGARWKKELPEAVEVLERGFGAATQFYAFPEAHWPRLRTTNSLERLHGEIKRRIKAAGAFPDRASALRLITAVALRTTHVWGDRRYLDLSLLQKQEVAQAA